MLKKNGLQTSSFSSFNILLRKVQLVDGSGMFPSRVRFIMANKKPLKNDVQGDNVFVLDLEWIGNSMKPHTTHVTELACAKLIAKDDTVFCRKLITFSNCNKEEAEPSRLVLIDFVNWLRQSCSSTYVILAAHNGIRYDAPVLRQAFLNNNLCCPPWLFLTDTLYHSRYYLQQCGIPLDGYSIDHLACMCNIPIDCQMRHRALYDMQILKQIILTLNNVLGIPFFSGIITPVSSLSLMLVNGIGPNVCAALPWPGLSELCTHVILEKGNLSHDSCLQFFTEQNCLKNLPKCNFELISHSVQIAAERHLQYIEQD